MLGRTVSVSVTVLALSFFAGQGVLADGGKGRSARLTPPESSPAPEARGVVVINPGARIVKVERLPAGEYAVLLDDGTGAKKEIGKISIAADEGEDDGDGGDDGAGGGGDGDDGNDGGQGLLRLSGDALPFGAASPLALGGRAIDVNDKDGKTVLSGATPAPAEPEPTRRNGRCPLSRPEPAVDEDAEGVLKLESGEGRVVVKVHLKHLEPGKVYDVVISKPDGSASESLGKVTTNDPGNGHFKVDSEKGDPIPFGASNLAALLDHGVAVKDEAGASVLVGKVCPAQPRPDDDDGDDEPKPEPVKPRCFTAAMDTTQEVPTPEGTTEASGTARVQLTGRGGTRLRYALTVDKLTGPAVAAHIHTGKVGEPGPVIIPLDHEALRGEVEVTSEQIAAIQSGDTYVNVHTERNPRGEVRGQLAPCGDDDDDGDDEEEDEGAGGGEVTFDAEEPMFLLIGDFDTVFLRGDANHDSGVDISDPVTILDYLFAGGVRPYCLDAADANDDGTVDVSDAIVVLNYLFLAGREPADPGALISGSDATADALYCLELR